MPSLSPTMSEGTIVRWLKKEGSNNKTSLLNEFRLIIGEEINPGDALCEIQTDKATMTLDTEDEGVLAKILVKIFSFFHIEKLKSKYRFFKMPDNSTDVKVGKLIALIVEKGDDWKSVEVPKGEEKTATPSQKSAETKPKEEKPKSDQQQTPEHSQYK